MHPRAHRLHLSRKDWIALLVILPVSLIIIPPTVYFADATAQGTTDSLRYLFRLVGAVIDAGIYSLLLGSVIYIESKIEHPKRGHHAHS